MQQRAKYLELLPEEELRPLIKCFWISVNDSGADCHFTTLPDGCPELIVTYRDGMLHNVMLAGILTEAYELLMPGNELKLGIRLMPLGKEYYLNRCPTLERFGAFTTSLSGDMVRDLRLFSNHVTADIRSIVPVESIDKRKLILFELLQQTSGNIHVEILAEHCCWSSRQINRYFNMQMGMPLKSYSNILKCYASYNEIKAGRLNPDLGYYDQSHFIREIRKHTGTTPKMLLKNEAQRYLQFNSPENSDDR